MSDRRKQSPSDNSIPGRKGSAASRFDTRHRNFIYKVYTPIPDKDSNKVESEGTEKETS